MANWYDWYDLGNGLQCVSPNTNLLGITSKSSLNSWLQFFKDVKHAWRSAVSATADGKEAMEFFNDNLKGDLDKKYPGVVWKVRMMWNEIGGYGYLPTVDID